MSSSCPDCQVLYRGRWHLDEKCQACGGQGGTADEGRCSECDGAGHPPCKTCGGTGYVEGAAK